MMTMCDSERAGRGILDCPVDGCDLSIIGSYADLKRHVLDEHREEATDPGPMSKSLIQHINRVQDRALARDINRHMVVDADE